MKFKIPFGGRAHTYTELEEQAVVNAMRDAKTLTQGKYLTEFESAFESYIGKGKAFAVNNATAALEMAAQLCQLTCDDEIIIPAHTFTSSAYPFAKHGGKIVWADIDLSTRVVTVESIEKCITANTKAIVVVHLYGYCADMLSIMALAKEHNLIVIEDVAQALGTEIDGQKAGTFGDIGIYSFHSHKNVSTLGEGGMLLTKRTEFKNIIPMLRHNGHCNFSYEREDYWLPAMSNLEFPELNGMPLWPNNYCLGEVECALGIKLLDRIDELNEEKRKRANKIINALEGREASGLKFHKVENNRHSYHLLVAECVSGMRDYFIKTMANKYGIQCVVQYYPLYRYPLYKDAGFGKADCPNTDVFFDNMVSLPFEHQLEDAQIDYIIESVKSTVDEFHKC
ncbi:MAG: DegT/DnrJ/EryC1/StrS family aminotransferase [Oceanospirillaceae bacterium]|nr:DegT/DnrJ/EryC1/StrS family aminotransferase [Oceanospirillaceae bacterium]